MNRLQQLISKASWASAADREAALALAATVNPPSTVATVTGRPLDARFLDDLAVMLIAARQRIEAGELEPVGTGGLMIDGRPGFSFSGGIRFEVKP